jgi:hypothetical protein
VNGDGQPDLLVEFDMAKVRLHRDARSARVTGWLKNSQIVMGEDRITVVVQRGLELPLGRPPATALMPTE